MDYSIIGIREFIEEHFHVDEIDTLLNSIRITNDGIESNLSIVNEMINDSGDEGQEITTLCSTLSTGGILAE